MSLSSTATIKQQLSSQLGFKTVVYFDTLKLFLTGRISRLEFDDILKPVLDASHLIQLHNALIISLFDARSFKRPITPLPDHPKAPPRKRRKILPYQGPEVPDEALSYRSARLKRWSVSVGRQERERIRSLQYLPANADPAHPRQHVDEIARERGVVVLSERGDPPGSRLAIQLASITRTPTVQHIADRMNLISSQHNLNSPVRSVASLMHLAYEVKLKHLITHALTLTEESLAISSVTPSQTTSHSHGQKILDTAAFETLFTMSPAELPNRSAAAMQLALGGQEDVDGDIPLLKDREVRDQRWQIVALLGERSTVREALTSIRT